MCIDVWQLMGETRTKDTEKWIIKTRLRLDITDLCVENKLNNKDILPIKKLPQPMRHTNGNRILYIGLYGRNILYGLSNYGQKLHMNLKTVESTNGKSNNRSQTTKLIYVTKSPQIIRKRVSSGRHGTNAALLPAGLSPATSLYGTT